MSLSKQVKMVGAAGGAPTDPPPDYEYAVTHPEEDVTLPDYRVAVNLPSYQQAVLDKGKWDCGLSSFIHDTQAVCF